MVGIMKLAKKQPRNIEKDKSQILTYSPIKCGKTTTGLLHREIN